jgi:hypothetical protein
MASTGPAKRGQARIDPSMAGASLAHPRRNRRGHWRDALLLGSAPGRAGGQAPRGRGARRAHFREHGRRDTARKIIADLERQEEKAKQEQTKKEEEAVKAPGRSSICRARATSGGRTRHALPPSTIPGSRRKPSASASSIPIRSSATPARSNPTSETRLRSRPIRRSFPPRLVHWPCACPTRKSAASPCGRAPGEIRANADQAGSEEQLASDPEGAFAHSGGGAPRPLHTTDPAETESGGSPGLYGLVPSEEQIARAVGSGTQDHLADIEDGNETALNAKRWVYATFFNRIKERVRDHWKPAEEYQRRDPTGKIYGAEDRYTLLQVNLKADGSLSKVWVVHTCGLDFLDDTAVEAFKEAQPFINPPRKLVEDGHGIVNFGNSASSSRSQAPRA